MGVFDKQVSQKEFDKFRSDIKSRLDQINKKIEEKVTDSEQEARVAADNAIASERRVLEAEAAVDNALETLNSVNLSFSDELNSIKSKQEELQVNLNSLIDSINENKAIHSEMMAAKARIEETVSEVSGNISKSREYLEDSQKLPESLEVTKKMLEDARVSAENMQSLLTHSMKRKSDIDEIYKEVFGHDVKSTDGNVEHVDGMKDELDSAYDEISARVDGLRESLNEVVNQVHSEHLEERKSYENEFKSILEISKERFEAVSGQLSGLLPGAMAEGLSAAYEKKKDDEIKTFGRLETTFRNAIFLLVAVSLIPFGVDIYLLGVQGRDLIDVIKDTPSLVMSIAPLYFPILWLAYSSNKKLNLSKRLIEEYTHKAVLGKTFSGLSNQIDTLPHEGAIKEELRTHLLYNVLQVSAENPGKLISNYDKSDHPLMEALEHSARLSGSMDKLSKLPGFTSIAKRLSSNAEKILREQSEKVSQGISAHDALNDSGSETV